MTTDERQQLRREAVEWAREMEAAQLFQVRAILAMESLLVEAEKEIEVAKAFHAVAIAERDYERHVNAEQAKEIKRKQALLDRPRVKGAAICDMLSRGEVQWEEVTDD